MKSVLKTAAMVAAIAGAALGVSGPARAGVSIGINIGVPGAVAYDYDSGGYCDRYGCPDEYWDMPVYYGPVFYDGSWYQGPNYYRDYGGARWFWVHGGWRRDEWRGPRPRWWRNDYRFGPALGYEFYLGHGFRHDRDHFWRGNDWRPGRAWDRNWRDHGGNERMHPDHMRIEEHDRDGHHDNDHHDGDHHDDHKGGGMMGGGGAMGGGGSMMMGGGNGNHHDDHKGGHDTGNGHGNSSDGDKPKHKDHGDGNGGNGH